MNVLNRPDYFKMHTFSWEWTYTWQRSIKWRHEFSPLTLQYQKLNRTTAKFDSILYENPYLQTSMQNVFIPKMHYTLTYSSAAHSRNPLVWETTVTEAGNILTLGYMAAGKKWGQTDKELFKNPYAQFLKLETDISKTWAVGEKSSLVAHANAGIVYSYGNSRTAPYSEQFYVGGANSIRAFAVRSIGSVALELCAVACGEADLCVATRSCPWDHNAARIILQEAGGAIASLNGAPLPLNEPGAVLAAGSPEALDLVLNGYGMQ